MTADRDQKIESEEITWPNLDAHGISFGIAASRDGVDRLVMIDESGGWVSLARRLGFTQSRWLGVYVREDTRLTLPNFSTTFPLGKIEKPTVHELRVKTAKKMLDRQNLRLSQLGAAAVKLGWKGREVTKTIEASQLAEVPALGAPSSTSEVEGLLSQTIKLGLNHLGQAVEQRGDGCRTVIDSSGRPIFKEGESTQDEGALFLRVLSDADLPKIAQGLVHELELGHRLSSSDFSRYVDAAYGEGASNNQDIVMQFHDAVDQAIQDRVALRGEVNHAAFSFALKLHESRPPFWRAEGTLPTPAPISVAMQALAADYIESIAPLASQAPLVVDISNRGAAHSFTFPSVTVSGVGAVPAHTVSVGGVFSRPLAHRDHGGFRVTRTEHEVILNTLASRQDDGLSIFVVSTETAGLVSPESRRLIARLGQNYELTVCDLDSSLVGAGDIPPSRLIIVRNKRNAPQFTASPRVPVIRDYHALWAHFDSLRVNQSAETNVFAIEKDDRDENRWQAPYIPMSQATEPEAMIPRNLLAPIRHALSKLVERYQTDIDSFVAQEMGWTLDQLYSGGEGGEALLSSEQIDALALGIDAAKNRGAIINADATGLGKGRVAAALMLWAKRNDKTAVFLTEKADLFSDIYRDIRDIGGDVELANPTIINSDAKIYDSNDSEIYRSRPRAEQFVNLIEERAPQNGVILSTYSQVNRSFTPHLIDFYKEVYKLKKIIESGARPTDEELITLHPNLIIRTPSDLPGLIAKHDEWIQNLNNASARLSASPSNDRIIKENARQAADFARSRAILTASPESWLADCDKVLAVAKMDQLKLNYLFGSATSDAIVILDESHNAAGESNIATNVARIIGNAASATHLSATYAKRIDNMSIYTNAFPADASLSVVQDAISFGGEPLMEVFSSMLAESGHLIRREHDLSNVDFQTKENSAYRSRNEQWADEFAAVLAGISVLSGDIAANVRLVNEATADAADRRSALKAAVSGVVKNGAKTDVLHDSIGLQYTHFASQLYNISRAFSLAINADGIADEAIEAIKDGKKPVIGLESTMESVMLSIASSALADEGEEPATIGAAGVHLGRKVTFRDLMHRALDKVANVKVIDEKKAINAQQAVYISLHNEATEKMAEEVRALINKLPEIPLSPIDVIRRKIKEAGFTVGEISGRKHQLLEMPDGTHAIEPLKSPDKHFMKSAFNNGDIDAVILSKAGATGISLHAGRKFKNQAQRVLIMGQRPQDVAVYQQLLGRVNRKDQVCSPICLDITSGLPAEKKLLIMQNNAMRKLSANTSANADNSSIAEDVPDIINRVGDEVVFRWLSNNPRIGTVIGFDPTEIVVKAKGKNKPGSYRYSNDKFVNLFTSRIGMLRINEQINSWNDVLAEYKSVIEELDRLGRNPLKSSRLDIKASAASTYEFIAPKGVGVFSGSVQAKQLTFVDVAPAVPIDEIVTNLQKGTEAIDKKYGSIDDMRNQIINFASERTAELLPQMLTKEHATVEAAMASQNLNAIRALSYKTAYLCKIMRNLNVGSIYHFASDDAAANNTVSSTYDSFLVTKISCPEFSEIEGALSPARIMLTGYSMEKRRLQTVSLNTLTSGVSFDYHPDPSGPSLEAIRAIAQTPDGLQHPDLNMKQHASALVRFLQGASTAGKTEHNRIVLAGNMLTAAQHALAQGSGQIITYSDSLGMWHHAVLMPKSASMNALKQSPHVVSSAEDLVILREAMLNGDKKKVTYGEALILRNIEHIQKAADADKVMFEIRIDEAGSVSISTHKPTKEVAWFAENPAVLSCLRGGTLNAMNGRIRGEIAPGREKDFFAAMVDGCSQAKLQILGPHLCREHINEHYKTANQALLSSATATAENDRDQSILASLGI